jgi:hypothetical protein
LFCVALAGDDDDELAVDFSAFEGEVLRLLALVRVGFSPGMVS